MNTKVLGKLWGKFENVILLLSKNCSWGIFFSQLHIFGLNTGVGLSFMRILKGKLFSQTDLADVMRRPLLSVSLSLTGNNTDHIFFSMSVKTIESRVWAVVEGRCKCRIPDNFWNNWIQKKRSSGPSQTCAASFLSVTCCLHGLLPHVWKLVYTSLGS